MTQKYTIEQNECHYYKDAQGKSGGYTECNPDIEMFTGSSVSIAISTIQYLFVLCITLYCFWFSQQKFLRYKHTMPT